MGSRTPRRRRLAVIVVASSLATLGLSATPLLQSSADATPASFNVPFGVPFSTNVNVRAFCDNRGSTVTVDGDNLLGGKLTEDVIFKNNMKGTQSLTVAGDVKLELLNAIDNKITIPKQPSVTFDGVNYGVGGNPYFSIFFTKSNPDGSDAGDFDPSTGIPGSDNAALLGRCVQGFMTGNHGASAALDALSKITLAGTICTSKGSTVNVDTSTSRGGVNVHILMDNNINKVVHQSQALGHTKFVALDGQLPVKKGWGVGGTGGNPLVFTQGHVTNTLVTPNVTTDGPETFQGRCKDLAP